MNINDKSKDLKDWVQNKYKESIDKGSIRHPMMTLARTKSDEKIQEILKQLISEEERIKNKNNSINEKEFSYFNHQIIEPNLVDKYISFPCSKFYNYLVKLNQEKKYYENTKNRLKSLKLTGYSFYLMDFLDNYFEKKYAQDKQQKENKRLEKMKFLENKNEQHRLKEHENKKFEETKLKFAEEKKIGLIDIEHEVKDNINFFGEKKVGIITNINQLNETKKKEIKVRNQDKETDFKAQKEDIAGVKNKSFFKRIKELIINENADVTKLNKTSKKKIGLAAFEKIPHNKVVENEFEKSEMQINQFKSKEKSNEEKRIQIELKNGGGEINNEIKTNTRIQEQTKVEIDIDVKIEKTIEENKITKEKIEIAKSKNADIINMKDLNLTFSAWIYYRIINPETRNQLKFYQGLKWKDIYIRKEEKDILDLVDKNVFFESKIQRKKFTNYWRIAFSIKPEYIIDYDSHRNKESWRLNRKGKKISSSETLVLRTVKYSDRYSIFYKLIYLIKPANLTLGKLGKLIGFGLFMYLANMRYKLYTRNSSDFQTQEYQLNKYISRKFNLSFNDIFDNNNIAEEIKTKQHEINTIIYDKETDFLYLKIIALEKILLNYAADYREYLQNIDFSTEDKSEQITKIFFEKNKNLKILDLLNQDLFKMYNDLLIMTETQNYINSGIKNLAVLIYSSYNVFYLNVFSKKIMLNRALGKSLIFIFLINEFAKYIEFLIYLQKYNFASEKILKNDHSDIFRYYFYRENIYNILQDSKETRI